MKNRILVIGALFVVCVAVGAMLFRSAAQQVGAERADRVEILLAGGAE
jgi:hypothetical protein